MTSKTILPATIRPSTRTRLPGNKGGGSTLEDKSLGCVQKSGSAPVMDVLMYGEPVHKGA